MDKIKTKPQELIDTAMDGLGHVNDKGWLADKHTTASMVFMDAQTRALIAIARELKRANDNVYGEVNEHSKF